MNKKVLIIIIIAILICLLGIICIKSSNYKKSEETKSSQQLENVTFPSIEEETKPQTTEEGSKPQTTEENTKTPTEEENTKISEKEAITVVPTMRDEITTDSSWCGTFQLVWNDLKNDVVKKDIIFNPQEKIAENLNKEDFTQNMISDDYYFKIYGLKSLDLKQKIEKGIKEKFNQESDILNGFDWSEDALDNPNDKNSRKYFFYSMLYRKFEFLQKFDKLEDGKFGKKYDNVKYFGIDEKTKDSIGEQINVLYYNSKEDFAIIVNTKSNDEVIFNKNPQGKTFKEIYENMNKKASQYKGKKAFNNIDEFKAPNITFNEKVEYEKLENKIFATNDPIYPNAQISKAIQTVKFSLDENGGEIKSEAAIDVVMTNSAIGIKPQKEEPRYFYLDDTFAIFLREKGRDYPYFAGRIDNITKFQ